MNILITGGAGFIGCNLIARLLKDETCQVICFDNLNEFVEQKLLNINLFSTNKNFTFIKGDICNKVDLRNLPHIDVIIHLAAKTGVRTSVSSAYSYYEVNVNGMYNLLEFARKRKIMQFIFASSSSIYGVNPVVPWSEESQPMPISPYGYSKLQGEQLGLFYSNHYKIRFLSLRYFNVFGPFQRPDLVIYKFFEAVLTSKQLTVFGDGSSSRDYSHVSDIVDGTIAAIYYRESNYEIFNLSGLNNLKLSALISNIENICKRTAQIHHYPEQPGDVLTTQASIIKAKQLLGYFPQSKFDISLENFYEWFVSRNNAANLIF